MFPLFYSSRLVYGERSGQKMKEKEKMVAAHARCDITNKTGKPGVCFETAFSDEVKDWVIKNWKRFGFEKPLKLRK